MNCLQAGIAAELDAFCPLAGQIPVTNFLALYWQKFWKGVIWIRGILFQLP
jgi:hypothetical protein